MGFLMPILRRRSSPLFLSLFFLAGCSREFDSPYLPSSPDYAGSAWSRDGNRNGVADSVEKYAPGCGGDPAACLAFAKSRAGIVASAPGGDTLKTAPKDTVKTVPGDTVKTVPVDTPKVPNGPILIDSLSAPDLRLNVGETQIAQVEVLPAEAASRTYELISRNDAVAAIRNGGVVGVAEGSAVISIRAMDGSGKEGAFKVTVKAPAIRVESISAADMDFSLANLFDPRRKKPAITWVPANAADQGYTMASADEKIAKIVGDSVEAVGTGKTKVTVTSSDGSRKAVFQVTVQLLDLCGALCDNSDDNKGKGKKSDSSGQSGD